MEYNLIYKIWEEDAPLSQAEMLDMMIQLLDEEKIEKFFESKGLSFETLSFDKEDGESITIEYQSLDFSGRIPNRISYYMEEFSRELESQLGTSLAWGFGTNGNCNTVHFFLEKLDPKFVKTRYSTIL